MPSRIVGVDEVGRGALAGPIIAAAVELNEQLSEKFSDSKKITALKRQQLAKLIMTNCNYAIGLVGVEQINQIGINNANKLAIVNAVEALGFKPDLVFVDGNLKFSEQNYCSIIKGDAFMPHISAASIVSKVYRDELMVRLSEKFSLYDWHLNKGYGTAKHCASIINYGASPQHRTLFLRKILHFPAKNIDADGLSMANKHHC